jgi:spore coat protein CotH
LGGGLNYLGESLDPYRRWYEQKGKDDTTAWRALATTTRVLTQTPPAQLDAALAPLMDVDEVLKFLALDIALVNGDGYWNDGSDFNVLRGADGRFRVLPHDVNEAFRLRGNGASPDPLIAMSDTNKALRSRLLAVPAFRERYLGYIAEIAERHLSPDTFGARVARYVGLIADDVAGDTRKTSTLDGFRAAVDTSATATASLRAFAVRRRAALLAHPELAGRR